MITYLDRTIERLEVATGADENHPMRVVTRQVAFDPGGWTPEPRAKVADLFNSLAPEWHRRIKPGRHDALVDALERGLDPAGTDGTCLEIGSGTGDSTPLLTNRFGRVVSLDLALEMLMLDPTAGVTRIQGHAAQLPFRDACADAVVLVNALLFPARWIACYGPKVDSYG